MREIVRAKTLLAALILSTALSASEPSKSQGAPPGRQDTTSASSREVTERAGMKADAAEVVAAPAEQRAADEAEMRESDLKAQQKMAEYAQKTYYLSVGHLILGFLGAIGLAISLIFNYRATTAARHQADAAMAALQSDRAWMTTMPPVLEPVQDGPNRTCILRFKWVNSGRTPARDAQFICRVHYTPVGARQPIFDFQWADDQPISMVTPGNVFTCGNDRGHPEHYEAFKRGEGVFYISSAIRYKTTSGGDEFKQTFSTFRCRFVQEVGDKIQVVSSEVGPASIT